MYKAALIILSFVTLSRTVLSDVTDSSSRSIDASLYWYFTAEDGNYPLPIISYSTNTFHIEARYNYEDFNTVALWGGPTWMWENDVSFQITPIFGGVYGDTKGVGAGVEASADWRSVSFYSEWEFVFDLEDSNGNFAYVWSELSIIPIDWFEAGLIVQRTRIIHEDLDVSAGAFVGGIVGDLEIRTHVLDVWSDNLYWILSASYSFH